MKEKIFSIDNLTGILKKERRKGKKIVQCHGVFDLLHIGHIKHLNESKKFGDILVVSVTSDQFVEKGPYQPAFNLQHRLEALSALECVDYVVSSNFLTATNIIKTLKPDYYVKGPDYKNNNKDITGQIKKETKSLQLVGGTVKYTSGTTFSSSKLLKDFGVIYNEYQIKYINKIKNKYNFQDIKKQILNVEKLKVLVVGETIIDRYSFCNTIGKSGKEPILVLKEDKIIDYAGGTAGISKQISEFCKNTSLLSALGQSKEYQKFLEKKIGNKVNIKFVYKHKSPTIVKKRYVDINNKTKILGVYAINDQEISGKNKDEFSKLLNKKINNKDLVIVSDYGHGLISKEGADYICKKSNFLAVNCQINANNSGYHTLKKYKKLDVVLINEDELRYELRDKDGDLRTLMKKLCKMQQIKYLLVTSGKQGANFYDVRNNIFTSVPAFAKSIVDKVGAGDAMLSLFALFFYKSKSPEVALLISSLAAANSVEDFGNDRIVEKNRIIKTLSYILK